MKIISLAVVTIGALGLSQALEPIQNDRNEVLINWHNDDGERKIFKIDDLEKDDGEERVHQKTLLQKYTKSTCTPNFGASGSSSGCGSSGTDTFGSLGSGSSCGSSSGCSLGGSNNGGSCSSYGGDDYGAGCATGYGSGRGSGYGSGYGSGRGSGSVYGSGYGSGRGSGYGMVNGSGAFGGQGAYGGQAGFGNNQGSQGGENSFSTGPLGTRDYNGKGVYDGSSSGKANDLSYEKMCHLLNKEKANKIKRANARAYLRNNKASRDNKNFSNGSQIDKLCKANERDCMIDACDSAKIANGDKRNDSCYANRENCRANEMKKSHNLVNCANRKNEHLNMNEKAKDNLHSHKRVVTEFDKLEHFKKCSENCKDAEKGRRARVNKANNINKNQRRRKGHRNRQSRFSGKSNVNQSRDKDEFNYCDKDSKISNRKILKNQQVCNSDNDYTNANNNAASCASDVNKAYSNDCSDDNSSKYGKKDKVTDYDANCRARNSRDRYARKSANKENRHLDYPAPLEGSGCDFGGDDFGDECASGYGSGRGSLYGSGRGSGYGSRYGSGRGSVRGSGYGSGSCGSGYGSRYGSGRGSGYGSGSCGSKRGSCGSKRGSCGSKRGSCKSKRGSCGY